MSKLNNILWVVVDSVRSYSGARDSRDFLPIIDQIAKDGLRFLNVQTSAPSTIMSTSAMMSGRDSIYHALTYQGFDSTQNGINYITKGLREQGYNIYFITFFPEGFIALSPLFGGLTSDKSTVSIPKSRFWTNSEINLVLEDLIKRNVIQEPFFFYLNYNCRHDPDTSKEVDKGLDLVFSSFNQEDTYLIINSDHGYPDPSRKLAASMQFLGHDIVMTEDNITVPLAIKGPLLKKAHMVSTRVGLLDIADFVISIANDDLSSSKLYRLSLSPSTTDEIYFTWNRYPAQFGGFVSACFRSFKLVYSLDQETLDWYSITSKLSDEGLWTLREEPLRESLISNDIRDFLIESTNKEISKVVSHFSNYISNSFLSFISSSTSRSFSIICSPTSLYWKIIMETSKHLGLVSHRIDNVIPGRSQLIIADPNQASSNKYKKHLSIYIPPGVSPLSCLVDICRLVKLGLYPSLVSDYDFRLTLPPHIYMLRLIKLSLRQLGKSLRARGLRNTLIIIFNVCRFKF